jgi:tetratricopeptide (TPR) repeat protein
MARTRTAAEPPRPRAAAPAAPESPPGRAARLVDAALIAAFLALTFLLGVFPLKDTDFWWHLKTGDMIRQTGQVPRTDPYTFGAEGHEWIDLHWGFQVALSWGYQHGGVVGLNLAKCVITCAAVLLLLTARRRDWPVWVMVLAWLPALYVLGGRMYVRPETLSLLYLSIFLAVLTRLERRPRLAFVLPFVQVLWVNTQGLFAFGPLVLALALVDAALAPGAFAPGRRRWWRIVLTAAALTGLACLANPYGLAGALYPIQLMRTMADPIFRMTIAELKPLPVFLQESGIQNFQMQMYFLVLILGALSFLLPLSWRALARLADGPDPSREAAPPAKGRRRKKAAKSPAPEVTTGWRLRPFRLLLYVTFSALSVQATRNSHQFAAVVGAVTAWNFGEWVAAIGRRRFLRAGIDPAPGAEPRLVALACVALAFVGVASGKVYAIAGEGRTVGLGEEPLWYPKEAVAFAGRPGMPARFVCFHNGHAALFEYRNGPGQKTYTDARLEVMGPELYGHYIDLERRISADKPGWSDELAAMGRPGVLVDNVHGESASVVATLLAHPDWKCVWFDAIAAVFVPGSTPAPAVDFAARHFRPDPATDPHGLAALLATAKALRNVAGALAVQKHPAMAKPLLLLGQGYARRALGLDPGSELGWKLLGQLEAAREPPTGPEPIARYRLPFDPTFDLTAVRATFALRQAADRGGDFTTLVSLVAAYQSRAMDEAALPLLERLLALTPINPTQVDTQSKVAAQLGPLKAKLGPEPAGGWKNLSDLEGRLDALLDAGRVGSAADLLEKAYRPEARPWPVADRLATLRLHLGQPARARAIWQSAASPPRPALVAARVAATHLVEGDFAAARLAYDDALKAEPRLYEARYGLAVLERDAGRAAAALAAARLAAEYAPTDFAASAARAVVAEVEPYARPAASANPPRD